MHYSLIKLLGGNHHKQVKQFYTTEAILEKLQPQIYIKNKLMAIIKIVHVF